MWHTSWLDIQTGNLGSKKMRGEKVADDMKVSYKEMKERNDLK